MDVGEGGVAGIDARRQQRRHLLNLGTLADEHHTLARGCPAVRKVEEDGCLAAAHQSKAVKTDGRVCRREEQKKMLRQSLRRVHCSMQDVTHSLGVSSTLES